MIPDHPEHGRYTLRDLRENDEQWMWPASRDGLRPYVEPLFGWDEEVSRFFFDKSYPRRRVIEVAGHPAGWLELATETHWLFLLEIGLLPDYRGQGLGECIIRDVQAYGDAHDLTVELQVLVTNPARRLYDRLGFRPTHLKMSRPPGGWDQDPPNSPIR